VSDRVFYSGHGAPFFAPLWLSGAAAPRGNLRDEFVHRVSRLWNRPYRAESHGELGRAFGARDIFDYAYALFHAPEYRSRYHSQLRVGFPRLPLSADTALVEWLCDVGRQLVETHTMLPSAERSDTPRDMASWRGGGDYRVAAGYPRLSTNPADEREGTAPAIPVRLAINERTFLEPIAAEDWEFRLGGYPVVPRWLQARRRQRLNAAERCYLPHLIQVVRTTRRLADCLRQGLSPWPWDAA
jgi:hypothetical protein